MRSVLDNLRLRCPCDNQGSFGGGTFMERLEEVVVDFLIIALISNSLLGCYCGINNLWIRDISCGIGSKQHNRKGCVTCRFLRV